MLMPNAANQLLVLQVVDRALPALVARPASLQTWNCCRSMHRDAEVLEALLRVLADVVGAERRRRAEPTDAPATCDSSAGSWWRRTGDVLWMPLQRLAEQPLAVAFAVRPGRVEEIAAELDRAIERCRRLAIVGSRSSRPCPTCRSRLRRPANPACQTIDSASADHNAARTPLDGCFVFLSLDNHFLFCRK